MKKNFYTQLATETCHYTPQPALIGLTLDQAIENESEYKRLAEKCQNADLPPSEKRILLLFAARHIRFNFSLIADYYPNATPEVQSLLEELGAVFVDNNDSIENALANIYKRYQNNPPDHFVESETLCSKQLEFSFE